VPTARRQAWSYRPHGSENTAIPRNERPLPNSMALVAAQHAERKADPPQGHDMTVVNERGLVYPGRPQSMHHLLQADVQKDDMPQASGG